MRKHAKTNILNFSILTFFLILILPCAAVMADTANDMPWYQQMQGYGTEDGSGTDSDTAAGGADDSWYTIMQGNGSALGSAAGKEDDAGVDDPEGSDEKSGQGAGSLFDFPKGGKSELQDDDMPSEPGFLKVEGDPVEVASPVQARNGVVRIFGTDDVDNPSSFWTGSGFGVGVIGKDTDIFVTNRHVVYDDDNECIASEVYVLLDDSALKRVYSSRGDFYDDDVESNYRIEIDKSRMIKCKVLYPSDDDPEYPDFAIIQAKTPIEGRVALELEKTSEVDDSATVWTIGYPGSADKIYNLDANYEEMTYEADVEGAQIFKGTISRRGEMRMMGNTLALTHNAQIDYGNSGGPLVTEDGKVIGINTYEIDSADTSSVGYKISIYIDYAMQKLDELGIPYNLTSNE